RLRLGSIRVHVVRRPHRGNGSRRPLPPSGVAPCPRPPLSSWVSASAGAVASEVGAVAGAQEIDEERGAAEGGDDADRQLGGCHDVAGERRSEEHTSELQSRVDLVCRLLLEKKKKQKKQRTKH